MKNYRFHTVTTMKKYNCDKWWIDRDFVRDMIISADSIREALSIYRGKVDEQGISISNNAMKYKEPMFCDINGTAKQVGYILTAKTGFEDRHYNVHWHEEYIELWVEITEEVRIDFDVA